MRAERLITMRKQSQISSRLASSVRKMPPLFHSLPGEEFDISRSEVVRWLVCQPEVQRWLFDTVRGRKLIEFDAENGTWTGLTAPLRKASK